MDIYADAIPGNVDRAIAAFDALVRDAGK